MSLKSGEESEIRNVHSVRHGETAWNVENKICGATESALTGWGREQVRAIGREIKACMDASELQVDRMFCSPPSRARDTAQEIADIFKLPPAIELRLREQNFGIWEGIAQGGKDFQRARENFTDSSGTGEFMLRLVQRVYNLLDGVWADADHIYLLIAHNGISRTVESYSRDMDNGEFASFGIRNAALRTYCYPEEA